MPITLNKVKPLSDYILVEPLKKETALPSGIIIPDTVKEKPQEGTVVAVGPGKRDEHGARIKMEVAVGQVIMYKKWGGTEVKIEGKDVLLVREEDIIAVIEN